MWIRITDNGPSLERPENTRTLKVLAPAGVSRTEVDQQLRGAELGRFESDSGYAWVRIEQLRTLAVVPGGARGEDFEAMIAFAAEMGWVEGSDVRALVQFGAVSAPSDFTAATQDQRAKWWRSVLGEYPTGVAIIAALDPAGQPQGLVVGTFSSVSMDPPLVSFMPMRTSRSYSAIANCSHFRVSVLGAAHEDLCRSFTSAAPAERFAVGNWEYDERGVPRLADAVVWFDCERQQTVPAGDHDIVLGQVHDLGFGDGTPGMPMLFLKGGYGTFTMPRLEFDAQHLGTHLRAAEQASHLIEELAEELGEVVRLSSLAQDNVVILAAANLQSAESPLGGIGSTFPFAAPMASLFAAWDQGRNALWRRAGRELGFDNDALLDQMTALIRERGYAVSFGPPVELAAQILADPSTGVERLGEMWAEVVRDFTEQSTDPEWSRHVRALQVPIFGPAGQADLALSVSITPAGLDQPQLDQVVSRCRRVTEQLATLINK